MLISDALLVWCLATQSQLEQILQCICDAACIWMKARSLTLVEPGNPKTFPRMTQSDSSESPHPWKGPQITRTTKDIMEEANFQLICWRRNPSWCSYR